MTDANLKTHYNSYLKKQMGKGAIISVSGFKKYLMIDKKLSIPAVVKLATWPGVRGQLDILYEDYLVEKAAAGGRNSQTFTQLLNKFYDKQAKQGAVEAPVKIDINIINDGKNKL